MDYGATRPEGTILIPAAPSKTTSETAEPEHDHDHAEESHDHSPRPGSESRCTRELVLDVPAEEVSAAWRQSRRKLPQIRQDSRFPRRQGAGIGDSQRFAAEIRKEVIDSLLPERFNKGVADLGISPVGQPQVTELTVEDGAPLHVKAVFEFLPDFSIDGYKDVTVAKPSVEVTEEEFQHEIEHLRESRATIEPVEEDRALVDGDWAQISYKGQIQKSSRAAKVRLKRSP